MSAATEPAPGLVAVACVVEASLVLAFEWSRILADYVTPLLKRLTELYPTHQFRLAFVTYGTADTRPSPLLSKRFFSPISHFNKELRKEPSKLGIGQTNSGGRLGLSALEGLVAGIELFDILMASINFNPATLHSPQKENRSLVPHLLHIAASPPDSAQRPQCNTLQHLDSVSWDTLPAELKKRKINLSLIGLHKIPQFQDLQVLVAGGVVQSPWFGVHSPHILSLAGFPAPSKSTMKRPAESPLLDRSPEPKRQKMTNAPPTQPPPANQNPHAPPAPAAAPVPQPAVSQPSFPNATVPYQTISSGAHLLKPFIEQLKRLDELVETLGFRIAAAQNQGQATLVAELESERTTKVRMGHQLKHFLNNHIQALHARSSQQNSAQNGDVPRPAHPVAQNDSGVVASNPPAMGAAGPPQRPPSEVADEPRVQMSAAHSPAQFWQSRGGTVTTSNSSLQAPGTNHPQPMSMSPELAAQMQGLTDRNGIGPATLGLASQPLLPQGSGPQSSQTTNPRGHVLWQGTFSWVAPQVNGQGPKEMHAQVVCIATSQTSGDVHANTWPANLQLSFCKEPLKDSSELRTWMERHRPILAQFGVSNQTNNAALNGQNFLLLLKLMHERHIYAYSGWKLPNGNFSNTLVIFPFGQYIGAAVFPVTGLPEFPGSRNTADPVKLLSEALGNRDISALNLPPQLTASLQGLPPEQQAHRIVQFFRQAHQLRQMQQLRRPEHQSQLSEQPQPQPPQTLPMQNMSVFGKSNMHAMAARDPHMNFGASLVGATRPAGVGVQSNGGGTVNMEMLQSFMQRSAEGSSSQGTNPS